MRRPISYTHTAKENLYSSRLVNGKPPFPTNFPEPTPTPIPSPKRRQENGKPKEPPPPSSRSPPIPNPPFRPSSPALTRSVGPPLGEALIAEEIYSFETASIAPPLTCDAFYITKEKQISFLGGCTVSEEVTPSLTGFGVAPPTIVRVRPSLPFQLTCAPFSINRRTKASSPHADAPESGFHLSSFFQSNCAPFSIKKW
ncbi:hypothetical protein BZA77DRAFT_356559 [Pyronema omphalodes]|nr:hypothetical protein BZA77DRAFT_356559 [Pyronema omphalodes]